MQHIWKCKFETFLLYLLANNENVKCRHYCNSKNHNFKPLSKGMQQTNHLRNALMITPQTIATQGVIVQLTEITYMKSSKSNLKQPGASHIHSQTIMVSLGE